MSVTTDPLAGPPDLADRCNRDGVFTLAARHWDARLRLELDDGAQLAALDVRDGRAASASDAPASGEIVLRAPRSVFADLLAAVPPPGCSDLGSARARGLVVDGSEEAFAQYYGAIARVVDLCREAAHGPAASAGPLRPQRSAPTRPNDSEGPRFDSPVGRYLHVELDGVDHRIYVETAGHGVPLLLQHTAGAHGAQWRHLFEDPWITDRFQLVAYDLPFHGKSLPPTSVDWWANPYRLTLERFMAVPLAVADGLGLVDPVFMGCSIGGLLALDLARDHPDRFRAVIGVEPALRVHGRLDHMTAMWHPRVDSGYKAALMEGLVAPQSPEAYRKETAFGLCPRWPRPSWATSTTTSSITTSVRKRLPSTPHRLLSICSAAPTTGAPRGDGPNGP